MYQDTFIIDRQILEDENLESMPTKELRRLATVMRISESYTKRSILLKCIRVRRDLVDTGRAYKMYLSEIQGGGWGPQRRYELLPPLPQEPFLPHPQQHFSQHLNIHHFPWYPQTFQQRLLLPQYHQPNRFFHDNYQHPFQSYYNRQWTIRPQYAPQWHMQPRYQHRLPIQPDYQWPMQPRFPQTLPMQFQYQQQLSKQRRTPRQRHVPSQYNKNQNNPDLQENLQQPVAPQFHNKEPLKHQTQQQQQHLQNESLNIQDNVSQSENTPSTVKLISCPDFDCNYKIPLRYLSNHINVKHSVKVFHLHDKETEFTLNDLQIYKNKLQIQSISNNIYLTIVDCNKEFLRVMLLKLPDDCKNKSTANISIYKQGDIFCTWLGPVATADDLTFNAPNSCLMINIKHFQQSEKLQIRSVIFIS